MKKVFLVFMTLALLIGCCACGSSTASSNDLKVGFIFLHDEQSTYDANFMRAAKEVCETYGVEYLQKTDVPEDNECLTAAEELADAGCTLIFSDSFGHQPYMIEAAKEFPEVQFVSATGDRAWTEGLANFHNAFAAIYDGRYLAGVAAGMKLNELGETKMGYVGAKPYAEVYSGFTSYYLGAKSVCPNATMEVIFTDSWYDETAEKEAATELINRGAKVISQHADSMGAPTACEQAGIANISYNGSTVDACPNTFIVSSKINWVPYMSYMIECMLNGEEIVTDWCGTLADDAVQLTDINTQAAAGGTVEKLEEVKQGLIDGTINVFDISTFTVKGAKLSSYIADVAFDESYTPDTETIIDGVFEESYFRSAPYLGVIIDGITVVS